MNKEYGVQKLLHVNEWKNVYTDLLKKIVTTISINVRKILICLVELMN